MDLIIFNGKQLKSPAHLIVNYGLHYKFHVKLDRECLMRMDAIGR